MLAHQLETDYLIIGSGAVGMAFADVILNETDASIMIVDKHHKPGGHWNDAYSFVTLHQPSAFYGVSSKELSRGNKDQVGLNKGLYELASGAEVLGYFDDVMRNQFLPSGRVQYFPMCEYSGVSKQTGNSQFSSILSDKPYDVKVHKKIVDCTYFKTSVPSTHTPNYEIVKGVDVRPLNELPKLSDPRDSYVIVGGGKTAIDAALWMLENQIDADKITWIMPRDGWLIDRQNAQPTAEFFEYSMGTQAKQLEAIAAADSIEDLFDRLEAAGVLLRIDKNVRPQMFHGATVSKQEIEQLQRIKNVVRMGRVQSIELDQIVLEQGSISTTETALYIDCSARAVPVQDVLPVFDGNTITVQTVRTIQPVFSAAFIAHIEVTYDDEAKKNQLCSVVPLPNDDTDWLRVTAGQMANQMTWSQEPGLRDWLKSNRLDGFTALTEFSEEMPVEHQMILGRMKENAKPAFIKLQQFIAQLNTA